MVLILMLSCSITIRNKLVHKNIPRYESSVFLQDSYRGILLMNCMKDGFSRNENPSLLFTMPPVYQQSLASYPW